METIPMHQAKSTLSQLVRRASSGERIFIGGYGKAEAVLSAASSVKPKKFLGILEGKLVVPDNFDDPLPDGILQAFEDKL
jgi:antitoxin (DNA-binding transcriptional repressor) of toxin-antitoxin stability system